MNVCRLVTALCLLILTVSMLIRFQQVKQSFVVGLSSSSSSTFFQQQPTHVVPYHAPSKEATRNKNDDPPSNAGPMRAAILQKASSSNPNLSLRWQPSDSHPRPTLVYCQEKQHLKWLYAFENFTRVCLLRNETPPVFDAPFPVFLLHDNNPNCRQHAYIKEAIQRRKQASFVELDYPVNEQKGGEWMGGVHFPNLYRDKDGKKRQFLRTIHHRPALVGVSGEVFWRDLYGSCRDVDFNVYRSVENERPDCLTVHFLQSISFWRTPIKSEDQIRFSEAAPIWSGAVDNPLRYRVDDQKKATKAAESDNTQDDEKFCAIVVRWDSAHPVEMFQKTFYDIDAIVRHVLFRQLGEYKPCKRIHPCPGLDVNAYRCVQGYKFIINMENTQVDGYVSEKIMNGKLAGGVPIYFGARDVERFVNKKAFVHCQLPRDTILEMRSFYPRTPQKSDRRFLFANMTIPRQPTDAELLAWAESYLRPLLAPCVERIIVLDQNDTAYEAMLDERFIDNEDTLTGWYPLQGVELAYKIMAT